MMSVVLGLWGILPVAIVLAPSSDPTTFDMVSAIVLTVLALAAAAMWARRQWPSRWQSTAALVGLVVTSGVVALQAQDPTGMLFGVVALTVLAVYSLAFHSSGYLGVTLTTALVVLVAAISRFAHRDGAVLAACIALVAVCTIAATLFLSATTLRLLDIDARDRDLDVVTGTLTPQAFSRRVAEIVGARTRQSDGHLVVTAVQLDDVADGSAEGRASREHVQVAAAQTLRHSTRDSAVVARIGEATFAVAEVFSCTQLGPYAIRLEGDLRSNSPMTTFRLGIVHTPLSKLGELPPDPLVDRLIDAALAQAHGHRPGGTVPSLLWFPAAEDTGQ